MKKLISCRKVSFLTLALCVCAPMQAGKKEFLQAIKAGDYKAAQREFITMANAKLDAAMKWFNELTDEQKAKLDPLVSNFLQKHSQSKYVKKITSGFDKRNLVTVQAKLKAEQAARREDVAQLQEHIAQRQEEIDQLNEGIARTQEERNELQAQLRGIGAGESARNQELRRGIEELQEREKDLRARLKTANAELEKRGAVPTPGPVSPRPATPPAKPGIRPPAPRPTPAPAPTPTSGGSTSTAPAKPAPVPTPAKPSAPSAPVPFNLQPYNEFKASLEKLAAGDVSAINPLTLRNLLLFRDELLKMTPAQKDGYIRELVQLILNAAYYAIIAAPPVSEENWAQIRTHIFNEVLEKIVDKGPELLSIKNRVLQSLDQNRDKIVQDQAKAQEARAVAARPTPPAPRPAPTPIPAPTSGGSTSTTPTPGGATSTAAVLPSDNEARTNRARTWADIKGKAVTPANASEFARIMRILTQDDQFVDANKAPLIKKLQDIAKEQTGDAQAGTNQLIQDLQQS